jgi:hypothetical protein
MSNEQKPIVGIGHEFPAGKVVAINNDHVLLETVEGLKKFSFTQIERFIHDERIVLEA